jgi:hypothetical protein
MTKKPTTPREDPPRPNCSTCGKPGAYFVSLEIKEMKLERDAGVGSRPYWTSDYRNGTKLETILCADCQRSNVSVTTTVSATLANVKEK